MTKVHRSEFLEELKTNFPEITQEINKQDGLLGFEIDCFRLFTQMLIDSGDRERLLKAYKIAEWAYKNGDDKLRALIDTNFLEDMNFKDSKKHQRMWARQLLPPSLAEPYEAWLKILYGDKKA
jgi:hypothetical protein